MPMSLLRGRARGPGLSGAEKKVNKLAMERRSLTDGDWDVDEDDDDDEETLAKKQAKMKRKVDTEKRERREEGGRGKEEGDDA